jgi:hypothetical protein
MSSRRELTSCSFRSSACLAAGLNIAIYRLSANGLHLITSSQKHSLDLLENTRILVDTHSDQLFTPVAFIQDVVGVFPQLFHMGVNQHLTELDEIAVTLVVDLDRSPGVSTTSDVSTVGS